MANKKKTMAPQPPAKAACEAFEVAMRCVAPHEVVDLASVMAVLCVGFLRTQRGDQFVRDFLGAGLADLDKPSQVLVYQPQTKH